ncbi:MAG TPA: hypothetical protein VG890_04685 [Puia sp.]|nr:hypothetical protein [Puia sp.]
MKKAGFLFLVILTCVRLASAQQTYKQPGEGFDPSRLFIGGTFGLSFGSGYSLINVSPQVGYRFTQLFAAGAGIEYIHYSYVDYALYKYTQNYAGMNVFGRLYPIRFLFLQAQPELDYVWGKVTDDTNGKEVGKIPTQFVPVLLLGGGAAIPAGRGAVTFSVLYDVIQKYYSPYYNQAVFSVGFSMGF